MDSTNTFINIPKNFKIILWKKNDEFKKIYILNNNKFIKIVTNRSLFFDVWNNNIVIIKNKLNSDNIKIQNKINKFLNSINFFFFKKIKFKGKGFRIKFFKKIKLIKFFFGKSHKTFILLNKIKKYKINKYKFIVFGLNYNKIINLSRIITDIKKINFYTLRGLRKSRQIIYKRKGKKGTYI